MSYKINFKSGITILESLIVFLLIGIIVAIFVYLLGNQRAVTRDLKRLSDVSVIQSSLSQYWLQQAHYPVSKGVYLADPKTGLVKLTANGFVGQSDKSNVVFLSKLPIGPKHGEYYFYKGNEQGYSLHIKTETATAYGPPGDYYIHKQSVDRDDTIK